MKQTDANVVLIFFFLFCFGDVPYLEAAAKAAAEKAKAEKARKEAARKANQAKYNALNKTVGGSSKLIKKTPPPNIKDPFAGREKKTGGGLFGLFGKKK